jgi:hypothetical protein
MKTMLLLKKAVLLAKINILLQTVPMEKNQRSGTFGKMTHYIPR